MVNLQGENQETFLMDNKKGVILRKIAHRENILPERVITVGDDVNDLEMLSSADLGVAFNAKRFLWECASGSLFLPNLDASLNFMGIKL